MLALKDLRGVVDRVGVEVEAVCREGFLSGRSARLVDKIRGVKGLLCATNGKVAEMKTHFDSARDAAERKANAGRLVNALFALREQDPTSAQGYDMYCVVCETLQEALQAHEATLIVLAQFHQTQQQMGRQCTEHRQALTSQYKEQLQTETQQTQNDSSGPANAKAGAMMEKVIGQHMKKLFGEKEKEKESVQGTALLREEQEKEQAQTGLVENEQVLESLMDESYDMAAITESVNEIAAMSELMVAELGTQADQLKLVDENARRTRGDLIGARDQLQKASEQKYSWTLILAFTVFFMANSLILIHMIRP